VEDMNEEFSPEQQARLRKEGEYFEAVMAKYGLDPDEVYPESHPQYSDYKKARKELGFDILSAEDAKKMGLLKLKFMRDEVFDNPYRVSDVQRQITYAELTDPFDETVAVMCELSGINHEYLISSIIKQKDELELPFHERETRKQTLQYLEDLKTYRLLCSMIKEEYQAKGMDTYLFFNNTLSVLLEKKNEYDLYWKEIHRSHVIDKIPLKRWSIKTNLNKLIGA